MNLSGEQCQLGSLTGAVSSKRVTEESKGTLSLVGNQAPSAKVEGCLTARPISRAGTKVGLSDPVVPRGRAIAHRTKGTPGITGLSRPRVHIDDRVWHLDVGSSHPGAEVGPKGSAVRRLKWHASWVQNVVRQFGPLSAVGVCDLRGSFSSTRGPRMTNLWCSGCHVSGSAG